MKKFKIMDKMGVKANRAALKVKQHAPEITFGLGLLSFGFAIVAAYKSSSKAAEVLNKLQEEKQDIQAAIAASKERPDQIQYDMESQKRDLVGAYSRCAVGMVKTFAPVIAFSGTSICMFLYSHKILNSRYAAAVASFNTVSNMFSLYRSRVVEEEGRDADRHYLYGTQRQEVIEETLDENGKKKKTKTEVEVLSRPGEVYEFVRYFEEGNRYWDRDMGLNLMFLKAQQNMFNNLLQVRGHVLLNEVLDSLGFEHTQVGAVSGWMLGNENGDGYIDFGLTNLNNPALRKFINGEENVVPLEFNCDGLILNML